ncbi:DUF4136 domain-containing protein [Litorivivens sp.]|uniref:DUF4136 domain-containing protein n=1 Tax=Litorivivens sp. TaxID=2020868 RepID=UPI003562D88B
MRGFLIIVMSSLLLACTGSPVVTDYDPGYAFERVKTYAWLESGVAEEPRGKGRNDLMRDRLHNAIEDQMRARGLRKVETAAQADILLTFHMGIEKKVEVYDFHDHFGYYPCFQKRCSGYAYYPHGIHHDRWETEYQEGRLVIDMVTPNSKKLVWRGVSERRIPWLETPEERRLFIVDVVGSVLQHYPPGHKSH